MINSTNTTAGQGSILATAAMSKDRSETIDASEKLRDLAGADTTPLFSFQTVFPFDLFPDQITIDRNKITINRHYFFFDRVIQSILITDVMTVIVGQSLLFASLQIVDRTPVRRVITLVKLPKEDARIARWIIEGLIVSTQQQDLDLTKISNAELLPKLIEIGKAKTP